MNAKNIKKKLVRLTESDLHRVIKESVKKILSENDYDYMDDDDDFNQVSSYGWSIYIYEKEYHSDIKFNSEEEAVADCDKKLEELNFYQIAKSNNNNEDVVALIISYYEDSIGDEYDYDDDSDVVLANYGFGWYD